MLKQKELAISQKATFRSRNIKLDILRVIGLLCIILAHTRPPDILLQLRTFDVPLMVIVSGAAFAVSSGENIRYFEYFRIRIPRLLAPTWTFLVIFFTIIYFLSLLTGNNYPFSFRVIIDSFSLMSGIGYVWIIRVFLLVAIVAPIIFNVNNKIINNVKYFFCIFVLYVFYEFTLYFYKPVSGIDFIMNNILFYLIPYSCLFAVGLRLPYININRFIYPLSLCLIVFFMLFIINYSNHSFNLTEYKYPPRQYYFWYGIVISLILYYLIDCAINNKFSNKFIVFISSSVLWIYLWHIFILQLLHWSPSIYSSFFENFFIEFTILLVSSIIITYLQKLLITKLILSIKPVPRYASCLSTVFLK